MDLNRATVIGRLTRDPEVRSIPSGKAVCTLTVATSRVWTDASGVKQKDSEFHNVVLWGKLAEIAGQYLKKGAKVYMEGRLKTREWAGQDGVKRYRTEIIAENMIMLDSAGNTGNAAAPHVETRPATSTPDTPPEITEEEIKVEDIPF